MTTLSTFAPLGGDAARLEAAAAERSWRFSALAAAGLALLLAVRLLTLPRSLWELDEMLFAGALLRFDPLQHWPHPPGYPLLVGLGKAMQLVTGDAFQSLAALSLLGSLVGYLALCFAFRRLLDGRPRANVVAVAAALLFHLSPAMLVHAPLALSDSPALMFLSLALAAAVRLHQAPGAAAAWGLGASASAAIGCRPQLALAIVPMLAAALWRCERRRAGQALAAFTLVSLAWLTPLVVATGGPRGFLAYQLGQASYVAGHDAGLSRGAAGATQLLARFVAHPWGPKWISGPLLLCAAWGAIDLWRRRRKEALPLAALAGAQLVFCLAIMDPADAARYALPWMLAVAFAFASGAAALTERWPSAAARWAPALAVAAAVSAGAAHAWPVLAARFAGPSPPALAAAWAAANVPPGATILATPEVNAHARYLLRAYDVAPVDGGYDRAAGQAERPLFVFAEGASPHPRAVHFSWPDSEAYRRLTRNHYRVVSLTPIEPGFVQAVRGVWGWEPGPLDARWRWLARRATLRIFPRGATAVALTLALPERAEIESNRVTLLAGGAELGSVELRRGGEGRFEIPVTRRGPLLLLLRSDRWYVPADSPDRRELAVQLRAVERLGGAP